MRSTDFRGALNTVGRRRRRFQEGGDLSGVDAGNTGDYWTDYQMQQPTGDQTLDPEWQSFTEPPASSSYQPSWMESQSSFDQTPANQLAALWKNLIGQGPKGLGGTADVLKGVAPILAALMNRPNTNMKPPVAAPGMSFGATQPMAPQFNRTQNMNPSNLPGGAPMTQKDWYTYGQRPEAQFFQNNQMPMTQMTGMTPKRKGGALSQMNEFNSRDQSYAQGEGDGTSDDIPANLSDGEYVMDSGTVSMLGNGSNKAGAQRLDELRENVRKHAGRKLVKGKQFMKAKAPASYMGKGKANG